MSSAFLCGSCYKVSRPLFIHTSPGAGRNLEGLPEKKSARAMGTGRLERLTAPNVKGAEPDRLYWLWSASRLAEVFRRSLGFVCNPVCNR